MPISRSVGQNNQLDCQSASHFIRLSSNSIKNSVLLFPNFFFFWKDFLWTMDRDRNGHDGRNGQEWTAEWTMDYGQWTEIMSRPYRANPNTSPIRLIRPIRPIRLIRLKNQQTRSQIRVPFHPSKQQPYKFSALSVLSVDKKWVVGVSHAKSFRVVRG
jgi:hypothetical protein